MKNRPWGSVRCDDVIGFLVAFEKKAKTLETCCEQPIDIIYSNDSTSLSIHPAYIRHEHTARRSYRGRSRLPAQNIKIEEKSKHQINEKLIASNGQSHEEHSTGERDKSDLTVLALDEVIEVVIETEEIENSAPLISSEISSPIDTKGSIENARRQDKLDDDTLSSSSALSYMEEVSWKVNNVNQKEENEDVITRDYVIPFRSSQKLNELFPEKVNYNQTGPCQYERSKVNSKNQTVCELKPFQNELFDKENKEAVVAFRDPISEIIPTKNGFTSSENTTLVIGDLVDIQNGRHTNKIGRVIKISDDLVLVAIVGEFVKPLYISQSMLRRTNVSQINIIIY